MISIIRCTCTFGLITLSVAIVTRSEAQDAQTTRVQIVPGTCKGAVYPEAMKAAHVEGQVTIRAVVGVTGAVEPKTIQITKSVNHGFDSAARTAFLTCHFLPARVNGQPSRQLVQQSIAFVLPKRTDSLTPPPRPEPGD